MACLREYGSSGEALRTTHGSRAWPSGIVGSVSHKGTVVVACVAEAHRYPALGIDIETITDVEFGKLGEEILDPPPGVLEPVASNLSFSVKEAVYKASFAQNRESLDFSDVILYWLPDHKYRGRALVKGLLSFEIRCSNVEGWVVSAALATHLSV